MGEALKSLDKSQEDAVKAIERMKKKRVATAEETKSQILNSCSADSAAKHAKMNAALDKRQAKLMEIEEAEEILQKHMAENDRVQVEFLGVDGNVSSEKDGLETEIGELIQQEKDLKERKE